MDNNTGLPEEDNGLPSQVNMDGDLDGQQNFEGGENGDGGVSSAELLMEQHDGGASSGETEQHRKLFVGGLSFKTEEESLKTFFSQYGEVVDCVVMRDNVTKRPRGFGFITFANVSQVDEAQKHRPHTIDGKTVETKRAMPKEESDRPDSHVTTKRMWVGGVTESTGEAELRVHFAQFGPVQSVEVVADKAGKPRGFAFVTYDDYDAVDKAILAKPHNVGGGRPLEVRKALSRADMDAVRSGRGVGQASHRGGSRPYAQPPPYAYGYGYYPPPGRGRGRGGPAPRGAYGAAPYPYPGYGYGYAADYGGYEYGRAAGWQPAADDGSSFGTGYSQYSAGGPMRSAQYSQRSAGPYGGYAGYGGGYGTGRR